MPKFYLKLIKAIISCVSFIIILSSINILEFNNITINAASTSQCKASSTSSSQCTLDTIPPIKSNSVSSIIKINNSVSSQSNSIESLKTKNSELCTNDNPISTSSLNSKINFQSKSTSDINSSLTKNSCKPCTNEFPKEKNTKGLSVYSQTDFSDLRFYTSNCKYDTFNLNTKNGYDSLNNFCRKRGLEGEANAEICNFIEFAPYIEKQKQPDLKAQDELTKNTPQISQKGLSIYSSPSSLNNIGKRLNVPYFNQFVDPNNNQTPGDWNKGGWYMCTAAATTAIAAYYDTFPYKGANDEIYKQYMFSDGSLIGNNSEFRDNRLNKVSCPDKTQNYTKNWYGVYGYTGLESSDINTSCRGGSLPTIIQGLDALGLNHNTILSQDGFWSAPNQKSRLSIQQVKNSINAGRAIIFSTQNHIFTIKGYTTDNKIIVNDSWNDGNTNKTTYPSLYKFGAGFDAVYDLNNLYPIATDSGYQTHFYAIEVWREGFNPEANKITDPNITSVQPAQVDWRKVMDEGCLTADNSRVYMWDRFNNDCQKMRYQPSNNTITNPYGKCLDGGDVYNNASNRWIRYSSCNGGNNQKWKQDDNGRIWSLQKNSSNNPMCIEYYNTDNGSGLDVNPCNSNQGQKWYFDLGITREAVPSGANIVDNNINTIQPPQADWRWAMDSRCGTADNTQVIMKARDNGNCQKMRYNSSNNTITNPYGKCLDAGDINSSNNKWIRFSTCHYGNNQRWKQDNGGRIWSLAKNNSNQTVCIEYDAVADQYGINANGCNGNQSQKWYFDLGITKEEVPTNVNAYQINRYGYNQCIAVNNPGNGSAVYTTTCNPNDIDQLWEYVPSNTGGVMYRRKGTNKCIDRFQASQGANTYSWECDVTAGNHAWNFNSNNRLINQTANSSMCLATLATTSGTALQTYGCNASDNRFYWNLIGV